MLGVDPLLGRVFVAGEDRKGSEHEVVLGYRLWQRLFNGDANVLGKPVTLNSEAYTVVGVMPAGFKFAPFWATRAEMWVPLAFGDRLRDRGGNSLRIFARLKDGATPAHARAGMASITARLERQYPGTNRDVVVMPLKEKVVGSIQTPLLTLLCACGFVLLIACANVAHMLLARTSGRQKEIAVRTALGAGRGRVIGQLLTENLLLAALGAAAGLMIASWGIQALVALSPAYIPRVETVAIDLRVVLFLLAITAITAVIFGLVPAMHVAGGNLSDALKEGGRAGSDGVSRHRLRGFLVASEFALAFMLLIGAGLMIRSFTALQSIDPGFNPHHVLSMVVPVAGYLWGWPFVIQGRPKPRPGESPTAIYRVAMPGYFQTMRLPVLRGRAIAEADDARAPAVVIVNERAAAAYWPRQDPLGQRISFDSGDTWRTVIGVVKNAKQDEWASPPYPEVYLAALQNRDFLGIGESHTAYITLVMRTIGDPAELASTVKRAVWSFDRNLPISEVLTMDRVVANATSQPRFEMLLFGLFAAVALVLAAVGIYGVINYSVSRRTREIGIRISLGASRAAVLRMVVQQGMLQALAGTAAGFAGALLLAKLMTGMLYAVRPNDPVTFGGVLVVLGLVALLASCVPARKATRIEPTAALRSE